MSHCMTLATPSLSLFFFFNDTATTEIYTLSLHDALPISHISSPPKGCTGLMIIFSILAILPWGFIYSEVGFLVLPQLTVTRSEEHTSELQSLAYLVCRLLLEKKKLRNRETPHSELK